MWRWGSWVLKCKCWWGCGLKVCGFGMFRKICWICVGYGSVGFLKFVKGLLKRLFVKRSKGIGLIKECKKWFLDGWYCVMVIGSFFRLCFVGCGIVLW